MTILGMREKTFNFVLDVIQLISLLIAVGGIIWASLMASGII